MPVDRQAFRPVQDRAALAGLSKAPRISRRARQYHLQTQRRRLVKVRLVILPQKVIRRLPRRQRYLSGEPVVVRILRMERPRPSAPVQLATRLNTVEPRASAPTYLESQRGRSLVFPDTGIRLPLKAIRAIGINGILMHS